MPKPWTWSRCLFLALLMTITGVLSDAPCTGLSKALAEAPADSRTHDMAINPAVVLRESTVEWDSRFFAFGIPDRIQFHLFDDCHFNATMLWTETDSADGLAWYGHIEDHLASRVILVAHGANASALIQLDGRRFDLRPSSDGRHVVQEINGTVLPAPAWGSDTPACCALTGSTALRAMTIRSAMGAEELMLLELVNQERSKYDRPPLAGDNRLSAAALAHSQDMSNNNYFSHTSQDGRTVGQRITAAGYDWNRCGENIARGYGSPEAVMLGWMNSDGHRSNISARRGRRPACRVVIRDFHFQLQVCGPARQPPGDSHDRIRGTLLHTDLACRCRPDRGSAERSDLATVRRPGSAWCWIVVHSLHRRP
jgi:hypothetical protein